MNTIIFFFILAYFIISVSSKCDSNSFKKNTCVIEQQELQNLHTPIYCGYDGGYLDLIKVDDSVKFYARTVSKSVQKTRKNFLLHSNELCNDSDSDIYVDLLNLAVSPVYEFIIRNRSNAGLYMSMSLPIQDNKQIEAETFCFSRLVIFEDENILPEVTCLKRFYKDKQNGDTPTIDIEIDDVPIGICHDQICIQSDNNNIFYLVLAIGNIDLGTITYIPRKTSCPYAKIEKRNWGCSRGEYYDRTTDYEICKTKDHMISLHTKRNTVYNIIVHPTSELKNITQSDPIPLQNENLCRNNIILPSLHTLDMAALSPAIEVYTNAREAVEIRFHYLGQKYDVGYSNVCIAAVIIYSNGTLPAARCLYTEFRDYTAYVRVSRTSMTENCNRQGEANRKLCQHIIGVKAVQFLLMLTNDDQRVDYDLLTSGYTNFNIMVVLLTIISCISILI